MRPLLCEWWLVSRRQCRNRARHERPHAGYAAPRRYCTRHVALFDSLPFWQQVQL